MPAPLRRSTRNQPGLSRHIVKITSSAVSATSLPSSQPRKRAKAELEAGGHRITVTAKPPQKEAKKVRTPQAKYAGALHPAGYPERVQTEWKIGAHVSAAGGVENSVLNAASIGANAFALFVKSQRKWTSPDLSVESIETFKTRLLEFNYSPDLVLPHGSYLINLGNPDKEKREKSYECFVDDLKRCELLGLTRYNFHPGSTVGAATIEESINHVAVCINRAHQETSQIVTVIENMAGSGNVLGSKFEEIAHIIDKIVDKSRVGVCLDTCHMFAAGYDIRSKEAYQSALSEFDRIIGLQYLRGMHINDSKTALGSTKDRHDNVGQGFISLAAFGYIMRDLRLQNIPLILETPMNEDSLVWEKEIQILNALSGVRSDDADTLTKFEDEIRKVVISSVTGNRKSKASGKSLKRKHGKIEDNEDVECPDELQQARGRRKAP